MAHIQLCGDIYILSYKALQAGYYLQYIFLSVLSENGATCLVSIRSGNESPFYCIFLRGNGGRCFRHYNTGICRYNWKQCRDDIMAG